MKMIKVTLIMVIISIALLVGFKIICVLADNSWTVWCFLDKKAFKIITCISTLFWLATFAMCIISAIVFICGMG